MNSEAGKTTTEDAGEIDHGKKPKGGKTKPGKKHKAASEPAGDIEHGKKLKGGQIETEGGKNTTEDAGKIATEGGKTMEAMTEDAKTTTEASRLRVAGPRGWGQNLVRGWQDHKRRWQQLD